MIHNFLDAPKISDYENIVYFVAPSKNYHPLGLFKDKNSKELNFPILFFGHPQNPSIYKAKLINKFTIGIITQVFRFFYKYSKFVF